MIRNPKKYSIDSVFEFVQSHVNVDNYMRYKNNKEYRKRYEFDGDLMKPWSLRYFTFIKKGCTCSHCGLHASHFYKEHARPDDSFHFNLYGVNEKGEEILFTKDHHNPKSKGGADKLKNFVTMCELCNRKKADMTPEEWNNIKDIIQ